MSQSRRPQSFSSHLTERIGNFLLITGGPNRKCEFTIPLRIILHRKAGNPTIPSSHALTKAFASYLSQSHRVFAELMRNGNAKLKCLHLHEPIDYGKSFVNHPLPLCIVRSAHDFTISSSLNTDQHFQGFPIQFHITYPSKIRPEELKLWLTNTPLLTHAMLICSHKSCLQPASYRLLGRTRWTHMCDMHWRSKYHRRRAPCLVLQIQRWGGNNKDGRTTTTTTPTRQLSNSSSSDINTILAVQELHSSDSTLAVSTD